MSAASSAIIQEATRTQLRAVDPQKSIWVAASAGTGKTKVLTDRVLNLMLSGTPPARILCLTFTRAAAAEMANRIAERLEHWAAADDARLRQDIRELTGAMPSEDRLRLARQLFARVLDAPGGMKIQTIHGFCQSLLKRFPLEAGIPPHFEVLDERSAAELLVDAREAVLNRARADADPALAAALAGVTRHAAIDEFVELMRVLAFERSRLARLIESSGDVEALIGAVFAHLAVAPGETVERLRAAGIADAALDQIGLRLATAALCNSTAATDQKRGAAIAAWLAADAPGRLARFDDYIAQFLTGEGMPRARLITKSAGSASPGVDAILAAEAGRLVQLRERLNAVTIARATEALLRLAGAMLEAYRAHKERRALLDYEDLVLRARDLLQRPGVAPWVLYKLDGGLDHILIDEAQDTNPDQWDVVAALAGEFFAGQGAREAQRTVFAVGDRKQSIFSFQRADPASFERMRRQFRERVLAAQSEWDDVPLTISFRSTAAILEMVDAVFATAALQDGLVEADAWLLHSASRRGQAGLVELWPPALPIEQPAPAPWTPPLGRRSAESPRSRLARLIAQRIDGMIRAGERLESRDRPVRAGDFLVLVRRRNEFVVELVRELKQRNVPVAGVDRMVLTEQLAVMDLMALGEFLLLPEDDLTLATVLKGPLAGFDEDALFRLAQPRGERGLWQELRNRAGECAAFTRAHDRLASLLARVDFVPPYELYAELLGAGGGRRALLSRLGPESADAIDEFLNLALAFERTHVPSLQGFLYWLAGGGVEVKRDLDQDGNDQVRVMTVHGAKGLQAPIVFLPDTMQTPKHTARLLWSEARGGGRLPLWAPRAGLDERRAAAARRAQRDAEMREQRRLLYVALTRAEDRLYVCGWQGKQRAPDDCWYNLVHDGLGTIAERFDFDSTAELGAAGWRDTGYRLRRPQQSDPEARAAAIHGMRPVDTPLPPWFRLPPPPDAPGARPLTPSRPEGEEPPVRAPLGADDGLRFRRGRLIHRLLELLPELPLDRRAAACRRFLARPMHGLDAAAQDEIARETLRVLEDPVFAPLFGPGSRAEVAVVGEIAGRRGPQILAGQIDRLVVTADAAMIVDYKTNRPPPQREADVPEPYLRQMAAYRAALAGIYPGLPITCALLWTDGPRLMRLAGELLDGYAP